MAYETRAGGFMALILDPHMSVFPIGGIISAKDFNAIPDEEGDTILWGEGDKALTKSDGIDFLKRLGENDDTKMAEGTWMIEVFHSDPPPRYKEPKRRK